MRRRRARAFKQAYPVQPGPQPVQGQQQAYGSQYGQQGQQQAYGSGQNVPMATYPPQQSYGQGQAPPGCERGPLHHSWSTRPVQRQTKTRGS